MNLNDKSSKIDTSGNKSPENLPSNDSATPSDQTFQKPIGLKQYLKKFIGSFTIMLIFSYLLSISLVFPKFSMVCISLQIFFINLYVYAIHIFSHEMPSSLLNFHKYSHHNKKLMMPRWLVLLGEVICNLTWFLPLILIKYMFSLSFLSYTLIIFISIWYASVHLINFSLMESSEHKVHHMNQEYNFGPPYYDMLFGTLKAENNDYILFEINNGIIIFILFNVISSIGQFSIQV